MTGVLGVLVNRLEAVAVKSPVWMKWFLNIRFNSFWWERIGLKYNLGATLSDTKIKG